MGFWENARKGIASGPEEDYIPRMTPSGVEVAGHAGVVHQVLTGQLDDPFRKLVADLDRTELTQCHR